MGRKPTKLKRDTEVKKTKQNKTKKKQTNKQTKTTKNVVFFFRMSAVPVFKSFLTFFSSLFRSFLLLSSSLSLFYFFVEILFFGWSDFILRVFRVKFLFFVRPFFPVLFSFLRFPLFRVSFFLFIYSFFLSLSLLFSFHFLHWPLPLIVSWNSSVTRLEIIPCGHELAFGTNHYKERESERERERERE